MYAPDQPYRHENRQARLTQDQRFRRALQRQRTGGFLQAKDSREVLRDRLGPAGRSLRLAAPLQPRKASSGLPKPGVQTLGNDPAIYQSRRSRGRITFIWRRSRSVGRSMWCFLLLPGLCIGKFPLKRVANKRVLRKDFCQYARCVIQALLAPNTLQFFA